MPRTIPNIKYPCMSKTPGLLSLYFLVFISSPAYMHLVVYWRFTELCFIRIRQYHLVEQLIVFCERTDSNIRISGCGTFFYHRRESRSILAVFVGVGGRHHQRLFGQVQNQLSVMKIEREKLHWHNITDQPRMYVVILTSRDKMFWLGLLGLLALHMLAIWSLSLYRATWLSAEYL